MNYQFPFIKTIDDVLPAIKDRPEFLVIDKGDYTVVNYAVNLPDTFPEISNENDAIRRECRGLIFDSNGDLISRRYHKFFNAGERPETQFHLIDVGQEHVVFDKLDGSMITPIPLHKGFRWGTKMGLTDVGMNAEYFAYLHKERYNRFAAFCHEAGITPIFEWVSRKNRIVVDYPIDNLILTAIRNNYTGTYFSYGAMKDVAEKYDLPVVNIFNQVKDIVQFINDVRNQTGSEGYVLRFATGHMLKFKTEQYVLLHKSKEIASSEHNIVQSIVNDSIDDLKALLIKEDLERVNEIEKEFWNVIDKQIDRVTALFADAYKKSSGDKKAFALEHASHYNKRDLGMIYQFWDDRNPREIILSTVKKNVTKLMKFEEFKRDFYI